MNSFVYLKETKMGMYTKYQKHKLGITLEYCYSVNQINIRVIKLFSFSIFLVKYKATKWYIYITF